VSQLTSTTAAVTALAASTRATFINAAERSNTTYNQ